MAAAEVTAIRVTAEVIATRVTAEVIVTRVTAEATLTGIRRRDHPPEAAAEIAEMEARLCRLPSDLLSRVLRVLQ